MPRETFVSPFETIVAPLGPRLGEVGTSALAGVTTGLGLTSPEQGFYRLDAVAGLPLVNFHVGAPIVLTGTSVFAGSLYVGIEATRPLLVVGSVRMEVSAAAGVELPSFSGKTYRPLGVPLAERSTTLDAEAGISLSERRTSLALHVFDRLATSTAGAEVAWAGWHQWLLLRAGASVNTSGDLVSLAGAGIVLAPGALVSLFVSAPIHPRASDDELEVFGLSVSVTLGPVAARGVVTSADDDRNLSAGDLNGHRLDELRVPGRVTIFEFGATWCLPCLRANDQLRRVADAYPTIAIRRIDVDEAPQVLRDLGGDAVPFVVVFAPDGREVGRGNLDATGARILQFVREASVAPVSH